MNDNLHPEPPRRPILVVDDEPGMRMALREVLQRSGWPVEVADNAEEALKQLEHSTRFALVITDFRMPGMTGLQLLQEMNHRRLAIPSIMMTAYGTVEDAVQAMRQGAADYLLKPFSMETVLKVVERAVSRPHEPAESQTPHAPAPQHAGMPKHEHRIIAEAPAMKHLLGIVAEIADAEATVLLNGESGTGKEVIAREIHRRSGRRGSFVAINCAALPEGLLESELFGHEKGAFTGAILARKGRFEQADGGTLLLDEISEMPLALQAKLLRVLQEKEITPVGGADPVRLDVRIIATSNRNLEKAVAEGAFRQDLYYRLNVIGLRIPPLRDRRDDVLALARHFVARYQRRGRMTPRLSHQVQQYLLNHPWPGNVRELENLIERACLLARENEIGMEDLHLDVSSPPPSAPLPFCTPEPELAGPVTLEEMERRLIMKSLDRNGGNRTRAASELGVSVRTIRNKLNQYGLTSVA